MTKCAKNEILRKGYSYTRKNGTIVQVPPKCIKDQGQPGKQPGVDSLCVSGQKKFNKVMHEYGKGTLKSGHDGKRVTNPKQAVAIAFSSGSKKCKL